MLKLIDAIEAFRLLEGISGQSKLRRAAALMLLCEAELVKEPALFTEPGSRAIELPPTLFQGVVRLAREKGVSMGDLVCGLLWRYVKEESERLVKEYGLNLRLGISLSFSLGERNTFWGGSPGAVD